MPASALPPEVTCGNGFAYAAARLPDEEARIAAAHTFALIASAWPTAVTRPNLAVYA
ncbi:hypothetical protein ABZ791_28575 [Streptomyces huasconensis]|uniref:Uncharacterized protein n=1 Tax=Streptomyces huasconensis TaxID=1854574 RepID=A0ABV3LY85_9ACTN